jgi:hypothetical protein
MKPNASARLESPLPHVKKYERSRAAGGLWSRSGLPTPRPLRSRRFLAAKVAFSCGLDPKPIARSRSLHILETATRLRMPGASRITSACSGAGRSRSRATPSSSRSWTMLQKVASLTRTADQWRALRPAPYRTHPRPSV